LCQHGGEAEPAALASAELAIGETLFGTVIIAFVPIVFPSFKEIS
jgi:hypothetical protein